MPEDTTLDSLLDLEERGWQALSSSNPTPFCESWLADDVVIVVPGMIISRDQFLASLQQEEPWAGHHIEDARTVDFAQDCSALLYRVTARRKEQAPYAAIITSVYASRKGDWKLIYHQQTPLPA
ncbi:MAG: nuclear transport factor 2 family protein [Acidimicrobiaceae bacterium]|nr:nuclear transport factor 2 family protein [Acidimicrobiaceae bacterium]